MEELAGIRFQNSELEARVKAMQRELEEKSKQSAFMESHQASVSNSREIGIRELLLENRCSGVISRESGLR